MTADDAALARARRRFAARGTTPLDAPTLEAAAELERRREARSLPPWAHRLLVDLYSGRLVARIDPGGRVRVAALEDTA